MSKTSAKRGDILEGLSRKDMILKYIVELFVKTAQPVGSQYLIEQYNLNYKFGEYISKVCDYVILIGQKQTKPIYDGLIENNYDKKNIFVLNDVREAFPLMNKLASKEERATYVLLENDLPDLFNE